jgi:hypothetical protein
MKFGPSSGGGIRKLPMMIQYTKIKPVKFLVEINKINDVSYFFKSRQRKQILWPA